jgi:hypothetical protein
MKNFILPLITTLFLSSPAAKAQNEFVRVYDQLTNNTSIAYSVKSTLDGGFVCIGSTNGDVNPDIFLVKTNDEGGAQWAKQCSGPEQMLDVALDIVPTSDGGYVFCGNSDQKRILWKVDAEGNDLWTSHFGETGLDAFNAIIETQDGGLLAVGDGMTVTKTGADGKEMWTRNKPTQHVSAYRAIKELANGDLLIGGYFTARDGGHPVSVLVKTDADGKAHWAQTYGAGIINAIDTDAEGNIWVAGNASYSVPIVLKIDSDGNAIWEGVYEDVGLGSAHSIAVKDAENAVVFTAGGFMLLNGEGKMSEKQITSHYGFNKAVLTGSGQMVMAGFSNDQMSDTEKFTFMKLGETGFPSPSASSQ